MLRTLINLGLLCGFALLLSACASSPDCDSAARSAKTDGAQGRPLPQAIDTDCRTDVEQAWEQGRETLCAPEQGFKTGHAGQSRPAACSAGAYQHAFELGALLYEKQSELAAIEREIEQLSGSQAQPADDRLRVLRSRRVVLQRDLPDLITLAQLEGWLPVSSVPNSAGP